MFAGVLGAGCSEIEPQRVLAQADPTPIGDEPGLGSPSAVATCFLLTQEETNLTDGQIRDLCLGTPTPTGPAACFTAAEDALLLTDSQQILLCRCAVSAEPVGCYQRLNRQSYLSDTQILQLCAPVLAYQLLDNCLPATAE